MERTTWNMLLATAALVGTACTSTTRTESSPNALTVACVEPADIADATWVCPEAHSVTCAELAESVLHVASDSALACEQYPIALTDDGIYGPGTHQVTVTSDNGEACVATLTVIDETPPTLIGNTLRLWPPNHTLHAVAVDDCVVIRDDCEGELHAEFIWASSDEPVDAIGDGNHAPDIVVDDDCQQLAVRAERQGPNDGRVYTLGVRVTDASGNATEGQCHVVIEHDQSGRTPVDSGEAYRVNFDNECPNRDR